MSQRELRAQRRAKVSDSSPPEPQAEEEAEGVEEEHAEAARLVPVGAEIEEELERARESARSLKEAFGVRVPADSLCCLVASAPVSCCP